MKLFDYKEFGRTEVAAFRFVLDTLLKLPDIVPSHFGMLQAVPDQCEKSKRTKDGPEYRYCLVELQSDNSQVKRKVFLQLEIIVENKRDIKTEVVSYCFCTNEEALAFDLINGPYISVK